MDDNDVKMNGTEESRGKKRGREGESSGAGKRSPSVDSITRRLQALSGLESADERSGKALEAVKVEERRVEYYPMNYARTKYGDKLPVNSWTKLITDADGTSRPLPQAYNSIEVPPGTSNQKAKEIRDGVWGELQEELIFAAKPSNGKHTWDKLHRDDDRAWYQTPAGPRVGQDDWVDPVKAGRDLPEYRITKKSSNSRGTRTVGVWRDDPMVSGMGPQEIAKKYGAENVAIKNKEHVFETVATLNERGEHEADRVLAQIVGNDLRYNRHLPDMVVQHKSHLVSVADIQNTKLWGAKEVLKDLNDTLQRSPDTLRIGMSTGEGDSFHNPQLMQKIDSKRFDELCEKYNLPTKSLARNNEFLKGDAWVQAAEGLLEDATAVKGRLKAGETLTGEYKSTQIFGASKINNGQIRGSIKSLYATTRDKGPIPPEVAKILEVESRIGGREDYKRAAQQNRKELEQSFANDSSSSVGGDAPAKTEPNADRKALVEGRQDQRRSERLAGVRG